jgi:rSAM/selenodomain-associated transferase 2
VAEVLVSIVIPIRGDAAPLSRLLACLPPHPQVQLIVSATDADRDPSTSAGRDDIEWVHGPPGRGRQLNAGAGRARGRWIWFVHADSLVRPGYVETFERLDPQDEVVGGAFRFALDSTAWQARLWEHGVALRVRLLGLAYGDQGIFVRGEVFDQMGGFQPLPLMEDVEFVRRLNRYGPVRHLNEELVTSARRWHEEGWWRRSSRNLTLLALYYGGVRPERLAQWYEADRGRKRDP